MFYNISKLKIGYNIEIACYPYSILSMDYIKPGKGQSFVRLRLKNLKNEKIIEKTFKTNEVLKKADVFKVKVKYLYSTKKTWIFMDLNTYMQYELKENVIRNTFYWLNNHDELIMILWNQIPISLFPSKFVVLKVIDTDVNYKGDIITNSMKFAKLNTGVIIKVPLFIQVNEWIKVNSGTGEYVNRVKTEK